ncbi:MAG: hypothetical protein HZB39_05765 [Planctomycetes bacterium]|nr:hypothetical protein [Planctomycetota bacterium]
MSPETNTVPEPLEPSRAPAAPLCRTAPVDVGALVQRLRAVDPKRAEIVASARRRLATGALERQETLRETARCWLGLGDGGTEPRLNASGSSGS